MVELHELKEDNGMSRKKRLVRVAQRFSLLFVSGIVALFAAELILAAAGFPSDILLRIGHPPNMDERRKNLDFEYVFRTNSQGLREREIPLTNTSGAIRVFISGDSFTEGIGVPDKERFTRILEQMLSRTERSVTCINGGLSGTGPWQYGSLFLHVGLKYSPEVLFVCLYPNDVANTPYNSDTARLDHFLIYKPNESVKRLVYYLLPRIYTLLKRVQSDRDFRKRTQTRDFLATIAAEARTRGISEEKIQAWQSSIPQELWQAVNRGEMDGYLLSYGLLYPEYWTDSLDISRPIAQQKYENMTTILSDLTQRARDHGVKVGLIYCPCRYQYEHSSHDDTDPMKIGGTCIRYDWLHGKAELQGRIEAWAATNAVPFLDLTPVFRAAAEHGQKTNWKIDGHWNPVGHELAAKAIADWAQDCNILDKETNKADVGDGQ